jgi:hypothetical protein
MGDRGGSHEGHEGARRREDKKLLFPAKFRIIFIYLDKEWNFFYI